MSSSPRYCQNCGSALGPNARFCRGCGQPVQEMIEPPAEPAPPPARSPETVQPPVRRQKKSRWGCCFGRLGVVLVLAAGMALTFFWWQSRSSDMVALGKREKVEPQGITIAGGTLTVNDPGNPIDGLSIDVPEGAYEDETSFTISTRPIESHKFGPEFSPVTPLIHVDNGGEFAADAMTVQVPIQISPDEFAMAFFYDEKTGHLEGMPLLHLSTDKATLLTSHFSDFVITKIPFSELVDTDVDTGFAPGVDDWQFVNRGSYIAQGGHCAGQSLTAMWYYYEQYLGKGERRLYGRYDNNNSGYGTIDFQEDDSWGYRWASVVQRSQWDKGRGVYGMWGLASDSLTWYSFAYAMKLTGEPQYVSIGRYVEQDGKEARRGHALIAYKVEENRLWVADPNYPGETDRYISFQEGTLQPYASGANANDIAANGVQSYGEILYLAKTALVNWGQIGAEYRKLLEGKSGEGYFPAYAASYLAEFNPMTGEATWLPLPQMLELDEADTAKASEAYRGKLVVGINMTPKAYKVTRYDGTQAIEAQSAGQTAVQFTIPLQVGVNDLGFLIENRVEKDDLYYYYYNDFRRVKVIYEVPDLSGTWEGTWQVEQAFNAVSYVEDGLAWALLKTGLAKDEAQAREAAAAGIEENPNLYDERHMIFVLTALDPEKLDRYQAQVSQWADDGTQMVLSGEATFSEGVFSLKTEQSGDGSKFHFAGTLTGKDTLSGDLDATAWLVVKDALTGTWKLDRQK